jgi:uncharacterized membrane protein
VQSGDASAILAAKKKKRRIMYLKQRLDTFVDAIIAIILTIMVLALPVDITGSNINYLSLAKSVGVYAVSFCFVSNIWYQHAVAFGQIEKVSRNLVIWDLILMFVLSLIPEVTKIMASVEDNYAVMLYGGVYLLVTFVQSGVIRQIVNSRFSSHDDRKRLYQAIYGDSNLEMGGLILANIVLAYFFPRVAMILFIVITVRSFFASATDEEKLNDVGSMSQDDRKQYVELNARDKRDYLNLLRSYGRQTRRPGQTETQYQQQRDQLAQKLQRYGVTPEMLQRWEERKRQANTRYGNGVWGGGRNADAIANDRHASHRN